MPYASPDPASFEGHRGIQSLPLYTNDGVESWEYTSIWVLNHTLGALSLCDNRHAQSSVGALKHKLFVSSGL